MKDNLKNLIDEKRAIERNLEIITNYEQRRSLEARKLKVSSEIGKLRKRR